FLCHYSVRLPCPGVIRRTALWSSDFPPADALSGYSGQAPAGLPTEARSAKVGDRLADCDGPLSQANRLAVDFLLDSVLFQFFIEIAARRIERLGGLRDVPVVVAQLLDEERALGGFLELAQCAGRRCRAAARRLPPGTVRRRRLGGGRAWSRFSTYFYRQIFHADEIARRHDHHAL